MARPRRNGTPPTNKQPALAIVLFGPCPAPCDLRPADARARREAGDLCIREAVVQFYFRPRRDLRPALSDRLPGGIVDADATDPSPRVREHPLDLVVVWRERVPHHDPFGRIAQRVCRLLPNRAKPFGNVLLGKGWNDRSVAPAPKRRTQIGKDLRLTGVAEAPVERAVKLQERDRASRRRVDGSVAPEWRGDRMHFRIDASVVKSRRSGDRVQEQPHRLLARQVVVRRDDGADQAFVEQRLPENPLHDARGSPKQPRSIPQLALAQQPAGSSRRTCWRRKASLQESGNI